MEKLQHPVLDKTGKEVGSVELDPRVFGVEPKPWLVHETVRWQLAKRRAGTHATLNRARMTGGGRKPFKQKGTGRARAGSRNSPVWVGGAVAHGPQPRSYDFRLPKRTRRQALASVLSSRVQEKQFIVVDGLSSEGKTKEATQLLKSLGAEGKKVIFVAGELSELFERSVRNIPKVMTLTEAGLNVYDIMRHDVLVATKEDIAAIEQRVLGERSAAKAAE